MSRGGATASPRQVVLEDLRPHDVIKVEIPLVGEIHDPLIRVSVSVVAIPSFPPMSREGTMPADGSRRSCCSLRRLSSTRLRSDRRSAGR